MGELEGPRLMPDAGRRDPQEEVEVFGEKSSRESIYTYGHGVV